MNNNDFIGYLKNNLNNASDGLIRQVRINLTEYKIILELSVEGPEGWLNLEIIAENISEFTIKQKRHEDLQVIFNMDIQIKLLMLDFCLIERKLANNKWINLPNGRLSAKH